jgi:hypothetical protein
MSNGMRWTPQQLEDHLKKTAGSGKLPPHAPSPDGAVQPDPAAPKKSKYRATSVYVDNFRFASILEADRYCELKLERAAGLVLWFRTQWAFHLPGDVHYRCDFFVVRPGSTPLDVRIVVEDTKGYDKQDAKNKRKQVEELYGFKIRMLRREDVSRHVTDQGVYVE